MEGKQDDVKSAWIAVGSSGVGKSSLINLFCAASVKTSSTPESCSQTIEKYESKDGNFTLIDTVGFEDSGLISNEEITSSILRYINDSKNENVKILWVMNPQLKKSPELQRQAQFINSMKRNDIWKSTIMIARSADAVQPEKIAKKIQGAIAAIKDLDSNVNDAIIDGIQKISYKCWDWLDQEDKEDLSDLTKEQKAKRGIMAEKDVRLLVSDCVSKIKSCRVLFNNQQCIKCGQIGDIRLLSPKCHFKKELYHPFKNEYIHANNETVSKHSSNAQAKHRGKLKESKIHDPNGRLQDKEIGVQYHPRKTEYYHPGRWENQKGGRVISGIFSLGISEVANWGYYTCCKAHDSSGGCKERWACCYGGPSSHGCSTRMVFSHKEWSCCNKKEGLLGCTSEFKYDCCHQKNGSQACDQFYPCCNKYVSDGNAGVGCKKYRACCNITFSPNNNDGCILKCCRKKKNNEGNGCKERCLNCKKSWNDSNVQGCGIGADYKHQVVTLQ